MQAAAPATPRQTSAAHSRFANPSTNALGTISEDYKLDISATRTPFTTPARAPLTPPDSGNKRSIVTFDIPAETMSQEAPLAQPNFSAESIAKDGAGAQLTGSLLSSDRLLMVLTRYASVDHSCQPALAHVLAVDLINCYYLQPLGE
jgi:hypothetical protein